MRYRFCVSRWGIRTTRGTIEGVIGYEEMGQNGFGYDPIFYLPEFKCSTAQLSLDQKNEISHRAKALKLMKERIINKLTN